MSHMVGCEGNLPSPKLKIFKKKKMLKLLTEVERATGWDDLKGSLSIKAKSESKCVSPSSSKHSHLGLRPGCRNRDEITTVS